MITMLKNQKGQTLIEYGLIIALISIALIVTLTAFGPALVAIFAAALAALTGA